MLTDLIYDVGAFNGDDTAYYLHLGYRVLSIEADPGLVRHLTARFAPEIRTGRCTVLGVGVAAEDGDGTFYLSPDRPVWNSFDPGMASREGLRVRAVTVPCRSFSSILAEYGVPWFLKTDIEGRDHLCVRALLPEDAPQFVSFEAEGDAPELAMHLSRIGYTRFRLVNQRAWTAVDLPRPGSLRHVRWSLRQWTRLALRRVRPLHTALKQSREWVFHRSPARRSTSTPHDDAVWVFNKGCSGPVPSADRTGWMDVQAFLFTWESAGASGILESAWFDVHAERGRVPQSVSA